MTSTTSNSRQRRGLADTFIPAKCGYFTTVQTSCWSWLKFGICVMMAGDCERTSCVSSTRSSRVWVVRRPTNSCTANDRNRRIQILNQWRLRKSNPYFIRLILCCNGQLLIYIQPSWTISCTMYIRFLSLHRSVLALSRSVLPSSRAARAEQGYTGLAIHSAEWTGGCKGYFSHINGSEWRYRSNPNLNSFIN